MAVRLSNNQFIQNRYVNNKTTTEVKKEESEKK